MATYREHLRFANRILFFHVVWNGGSGYDLDFDGAMFELMCIGDEYLFVDRLTI